MFICLKKTSHKHLKKELEILDLKVNNINYSKICGGITMPLQFGFLDYKKPQWKTYLDDAPNYVIEETGLSREKLEQVLEVLYDHRVIN